MAKQGTKVIILFFFVGSLSILSILLARHTQKNIETENSPKSGARADIVVRDLAFIPTSAGEVEWRILAETAEIYESEDRAEFKNAKVRFKTQKGMNISFEGDKGTIDTSTYDFTIQNSEDDITVEINHQYIVRTKGLSWKNNEKKIYSNTSVRVNSPQWSIAGNRLQIDTIKEEILVAGDVQAVIQDAF